VIIAKVVWGKIESSIAVMTIAQLRGIQTLLHPDKWYNYPGDEKEIFNGLWNDVKSRVETLQRINTATQ
jgi:hypothetical protein